MNRLGEAIAASRPRVVAALAVHCRDLDLAEDAFAEASARCLELASPPHNLAGWLLTVAKRRIVDTLRRRAVEARAIADAALEHDMAEILNLPEPIPDERLRLLFICCHPAIALEARAALALRVICGLPVAEIARVFFASEQAMFQRITRAKRKVKEAGIAFELPPRSAWGERLEAVLLTLELACTAAYQDAAGERTRIDGARASDEVARLAAMLADLLPHEPEALGLAALVHLARSRERARVDEAGAMVPLSEQDPALWDYAAIERARRWLDQAAALGQSGPYQVMAAIQLSHARRGFDGRTDWAAIVRLYDALLLLRPGAVTALNRAAALAQAEGAQAGLDALEAVEASALASARPFHAARAAMLAMAGQREKALAAYHAALALDPPRAERLFLERRRAALVR